MIILSIETSCDDTSLALIKTRGKNRVCFDALSSIVSSQIKIHKKWGGVFPAMAVRAHQKNLIPVLKKVLKKAKELKIVNCKMQIENGKLKNEKINIIKEILKREPELLNSFLKFFPKIKKPEIDLMAVTEGPGLEPCLWTGINLTKVLSFLWEIPIVPVNHIQSHIFANFIEKKINLKNNSDFFPALALIVSGGHTQLILMNNFNKYKILGETQDDAAGECLDKTARVLGLEYPGGPVIEKKAKEWKIANCKLQIVNCKIQNKNDTLQMSNCKFKIDLPRPMINSKNYDFSFSGLKTAVLYDFKKRNSKIKKDENYIRQICFEIQNSIIEVLIKKTLKAARDFRVKTILLGGGVVSNQELRNRMEKAVKNYLPETNFLMPKKIYCTDNAAMTGIGGYFNFLEGKIKKWKNLKAKPNLRIN